MVALLALNYVMAAVTELGLALLPTKLLTGAGLVVASYLAQGHLVFRGPSRERCAVVGDTRDLGDRGRAPRAVDAGGGTLIWPSSGCSSDRQRVLYVRAVALRP
jgi:hypothetical protein